MHSCAHTQTKCTEVFLKKIIYFLSVKLLSENLLIVRHSNMAIYAASVTSRSHRSILKAQFKVIPVIDFPRKQKKLKGANMHLNAVAHLSGRVAAAAFQSRGWKATSECAPDVLCGCAATCLQGDTNRVWSSNWNWSFSWDCDKASLTWGEIPILDYGIVIHRFLSNNYTTSFISLKLILRWAQCSTFFMKDLINTKITKSSVKQTPHWFLPALFYDSLRKYTCSFDSPASCPPGCLQLVYICIVYKLVWSQSHCKLACSFESTTLSTNW